MNVKSTISIAIFVLFLLAIFLLIMRQKERDKEFYKSGFKGRVVSTEKENKGYYHIRFLDGDSPGNFSIRYDDSSLQVYSGDSIYKKANSGTIHVKKSEDSVFAELKLRNAH